jgi:hypothetical protein
MNQSNAVLSDEQFVEIGGYVRARFHQWLLEDRELNGDAVSGQLNRIESSLEASVVLARERFDMATQRFEAMDRRFEEQMEFSRERFALVEKRFEVSDRCFEELMKFSRERFALVDKRFDLVEERFIEQRSYTEKMYSQVDKRLDETNGRLKNQFALIIAGSGTILAAITGVLIQGLFG